MFSRSRSRLSTPPCAPSRRSTSASDENPLAGQAEPRRIFGAAPGAYGVGSVGAARRVGTGATARELAETYLAASNHAYGAKGDALAPAPENFATRVRGADAFVHVQDLAGQDVLNADAFADA